MIHVEGDEAMRVARGEIDIFFFHSKFLIFPFQINAFARTTKSKKSVEAGRGSRVSSQNTIEFPSQNKEKKIIY